MLSRRPNTYPAQAQGLTSNESFFDLDRWSKGLLAFVMSPAMQEFYPVKPWNLDWELMSKKVANKANWYWENKLWDVTKMISYLLKHDLALWMLQSKIDGMLPWRAQLKTSEKLQWKGRKGFRDAKFFSVGEKLWMKKSGGLAFV